MGAYVAPVLLALTGLIGSLYAAWVQLRTKREDGQAEFWRANWDSSG